MGSHNVVAKVYAGSIFLHSVRMNLIDSLALWAMTQLVWNQYIINRHSLKVTYEALCKIT